MVEELAHLVSAILGVLDVGPHDRLAEDLDAESIDVVNIVAAVEERYDIELDDLDLAELRTVADLAAIVAAAIEGRPA